MSEPASPRDESEIVDTEPQRREPVFNLPPIVVAIIGACVFIHLAREYVLSPDQDFALLVRAAFIPIQYSGQYHLDIWAFTSPLTYAFLHGGFAHLFINMVWLAAFGSPLANRLGVLRFSLFFAVTSLAAVALHYILHSMDQAPLVGASGAISGMMGAAARFSFQIDRSQGKPAFAGAPLPIRDVFRSRTAMTFLGVWMVINLVTGMVGFTPGVDNQIAWEAHIGGFLAGFLGIRFFDRRNEFA
ncbi:rhomboid family intramembrane serine protease [Aminobacter sp. AP02]|uniref:rhomboid family intramembrane serine protease n=1 Tax=Aminobacter sp. AP02 TaxID=2135737 RepID=UPI000D6CEF99|nr:rhomboid family intramembrane serine protease [Aminobacter sp. AP02]PWK65818.1 membrane associated rhomboid family serine protease [Aminobacter sp. AP02]